ncbi:uncharacterized protein LOC133886315 [Phragmites australis]|uniref:uncharacterized protein LOC133886315 n=1 Tax=Phragmites australis TaxID=29695 RepID=UPI002D76AE5C|nr:uncharacterized protein LOC133886315 [Phragmites australis]
MASPRRSRGRTPPGTDKVGTSGNAEGDKTPSRSPTPRPRRSPSHRSCTRDARRPQEVVIECVIRETGGSSNWPQLLMKLKLQARHLWDAVEHGDVEFHDDRTALDAICSAVPPEMVSTLVTKESVKDAWEAIKTLCIGDDRVWKATAQNLRAEYEVITLHDGEAIEDFALRLTGIVQRLAALGDLEADTKVVAKYLRVVRPRYKQLVISIEILLDISQLSIEEVMGRLKAVDDVKPSLPQDAGGKLLLTEEQWIERYKKRKQESGWGSSTSGGHGKHRGKGRGRGAGGNTESRTGSSSGRANPDDICKNYGKKGHWAKDCRGKKREEQAHVAQDDEPTLLLALGAVDYWGAHLESSTPSPLSLPSHDGTTAAPCQFELMEEKVFATFDAADDRDPKRWVLDTGATNHMTGSRAAFSDLDTGIVGMVHFGDGSVVKIEGRGTILFAYKNGEHRAFANVYFIPHLTANIISVGQLDEAGLQVLVEGGVMRVHDKERVLLTKIHRSPSRLYVLDINIAWPVCLAAHANKDAWLWHARFGHVNFGALRKMPLLNQVEQVCDACLAGKHRRTPFP